MRIAKRARPVGCAQPAQGCPLPVRLAKVQSSPQIPLAAGPIGRMRHESCRRRHRTRHDGRCRGQAPGRQRPQGADIAQGAQRRHRGARQGRRDGRCRRQGNRRHRFHPFDPPAGRRRRAGRAVRACAHRQQQQAGVRRLQRGEPADGGAHRCRDRTYRLAVRRCRHHRRAAQAGRCRPALLCLRPRRAALRENSRSSGSTCA